MPRYSFDPNELHELARSCTTSTNSLVSETANLNVQIGLLRDLLRGLPRLAQEQTFDALSRNLGLLVDVLDESNVLIASIMTQVDQFLASVSE